MASFKELFKNVFSKTEPVAVESFTDGQSWLAALASGTVGGFASKFVTDIYKERVLFPHDEMQTAQKAYKYNSYINSSVRTRANFMLGGEISVRSEDSGTEKWLNEMINETGLNRYPQFIGIDATNTGNWYAERIRDGQKIVFYDYISHPERMYINIDDKGLVKDYFQEVPERWSKTQFKSIKYYGDRRKAIKGVSLPKDKVFHLKLGVAEIPVYGRGPVCALTNDVEILLAVERSMAVIAHYKGIPKKLIQLKRQDQDAVSAMKAAEAYANMISNLADEDNPVLPEEIKVDDLSYSGKDLNFEPFIQYLKKKITVALAPSFIVHGEETNYAVSRDQKEAWIKEIEAERSLLGLQIHKELLLIAQSHGKRVKDFEVIFGKFDLGQTEEKIEYASKAFASNLITLNEAREIMGYQEDKEIGESYSNELQANSQLGGGGPGDESDFSEPSGEEGERPPEFFEDDVPATESLKESVPDGAVRLAPGQTPPPGAKTGTGPKGGKYYIPSGKKDKKDAPSDTKVVINEEEVRAHLKAYQTHHDTLKNSFKKNFQGRHIYGRIKDLESIKGKLKTKSDRYKSANDIKDISGIRIESESIGDVYSDLEKLKANYKVVNVKDYIDAPNGPYMSVHAFVEDEEGKLSEVQLRTKNMTVLGDFMHDSIYKVPPDKIKQVMENKHEIDNYVKKFSEFYYNQDVGNTNRYGKVSEPACTETIKQVIGCL